MKQKIEGGEKVNYKRKKQRNKSVRFPKNGTWSRMCHKWWLILWGGSKKIGSGKNRRKILQNIEMEENK